MCLRQPIGPLSLAAIELKCVTTSFLRRFLSLYDNDDDDDDCVEGGGSSMVSCLHIKGDVKNDGSSFSAL